MKNELNIAEIIDQAIRREEEAYAFYCEAASRMSNQAVKEAFSNFAQEEAEHKEFLMRCLDDPRLLQNLPVPTDYKVAEAENTPVLSIDLKPADAVALAMKKEQAAVDLYRALADKAVDPIYKKTFDGLAKMELGHKVRLENLFVNIGFPEVF